MNLLEYLNGNNNDLDLDANALVFDEQLDSVLNSVQNKNNPELKVKSLGLSDNRRFLLANLLKEINENGIYNYGFSLLPAEYFHLVEMVPISEISNLFKEDDNNQN
jgi:hypothetical protein